MVFSPRRGAVETLAQSEAHATVAHAPSRQHVPGRLDVLAGCLSGISGLTPGRSHARPHLAAGTTFSQTDSSARAARKAYQHPDVCSCDDSMSQGQSRAPGGWPENAGDTLKRLRQLSSAPGLEARGGEAQLALVTRDRGR